MEINRVGVDLVKNVFRLHGVDRKGKALWKRRLTEVNGLRFYTTQSNSEPKMVWRPVPAPTTGPGS